MIRVVFKCPKCGSRFHIDGYWNWIFHSPFHWFGKRLTRCEYCEEKSWLSWIALGRHTV